MRYFAPNIESLGINADSLLRSYIPVFVEAGTEEKYSFALMAFLSSFKDGHAIPFCSFRYRMFGHYSYPFDLRVAGSAVIVNRTIENKKCRRTGILAGDTVLELNGSSVDAGNIL